MMNKKINIRKRNNYYEYRFEISKVDGKRKWISKSGFKDEYSALKAGEEAYNSYINGGDFYEPSLMSYSDFLDIWIIDEKRRLSYNTIESYSSVIRLYIKPKLGSYMLSSIKFRTLNRFIKDIISETDFSKSYYINILKVIKASFKYAYTNEYIDKNPSLMLQIPKSVNEEDEKKHTYTEEEINLILERFENNDSFVTAFLIARYTGMRTGEILALTWSNIDFDNNLIYVNYSVYDKPKDLKGRWYIGPTKNRKNRVIPLDVNLKNLLIKYKSKQDNNKLLLGNKYNYYCLDNIIYKKSIIESAKIVKTTNTNKNIVDFIITKADGSYVGTDILKYPFKIIHNELGIKKCRFYDNRGTFATLLKNNGVDIELVSSMLGHSSIGITQKYYIRENEILLKNEMKKAINDNSSCLLTNKIKEKLQK